MKDKLSIAFCGFQHGHSLGIWRDIAAHPDCAIAGACEADRATRERLAKTCGIRADYERLSDMLRDVACEAVAIGDVFARRGAAAIAALQAGKHVLSDKPLCTRLDELETIERLSREKGLSVICQFDIPSHGALRTLREIILGGRLGKIQTITLSAQHGLRMGSREHWYFEAGMHGGTINDIGAHAIDLLPWLTGHPWKKMLLARTWNAKAANSPMNDAAQFYGLLEGNAACFADVSYLAPESLKTAAPQYWRITVHGTGGAAETNLISGAVDLATDADSEWRRIPAAENMDGEYLRDFLNEVAGRPSKDGLTTRRVLHSTRIALETQAMADADALARTPPQA